MHIYRIIVFLSLLASSLSNAGEQAIIHVENGVDYLVPKDSPVKLASIGQYNLVNFEGQFILTGTYHYGYLNADVPEADATYNILELYFLPDQKIANQLPYWKQRGKVHEMWFSNRDEFINAVIPEKIVEQLKRKEKLSVTGKVSILVNDYRVSIECDYPGYSVNFISVYKPSNFHVGSASIQQYGC